MNLTARAGTTAAASAEGAALGSRRALPRVTLRLPDARRLARRLAALLWRCAPPVAAGLAASIPVLVSTANAVNAGWVPAGDDGIIATRGWDVLSAHTPNVGQYSEAGLVIAHQIMHSPGPMLYWLIALPARFGSVTSVALTIGIANTLAIIGTVALARRRGGLVLMFAAAIGIALMCESLPSESLHDIWNPAAGLFPFLLLVFLGWSVACGDVGLLPLTALVASFVVQTHLMYGPPTAVVLALATIGLIGAWVGRRRLARSGHRGGRRAWPWVLAALAVAAACWTPPAIDQIENNPGNLTLIVRTIEHRGHALGTKVGWNAVVRSIGVAPWWLSVPATEWERKYDVGALVRPGATRASAPNAGETSSAIVILGALGAVALLGMLVLRWDVVGAAVIALGLCGAIGAEAASNPTSPLLAGTLGYTMWWGSEVGFFVWLVLAWALWLGLSTMLSPRARRALHGRARALPARARTIALGAASIAGLGATVAVGAAVASTLGHDSHAYEYGPTRVLAAAIERAVPSGATIDYHTLRKLPLGTQPIEPAIRFFLVRHGDRVLALGSFPRLGAYYELYDRPYRWEVLLVNGPTRVHGMRLVARVHVTDGWGTQTLSAWVRRVRRPREPAPRTATLKASGLPAPRISAPQLPSATVSPRSAAA